MFFECKNIEFDYNENKILKNISLEFKKGEFVGLVGDNGSGKSTLMKILSGIYEPKNGKIIYENEELNIKNRTKIGYVFQNPENQIVGVTVDEDIAFGLENTGVPREEMIKKIKWALDVVGLNEKEKADPNTLSGGQKQRLAIASIVAMDPSIIFMDEPTTMLDPKGRLEVYKVIKKLVNMGKTIIIASHHAPDLNEVDRIIGLKNGKVIYDGNRDKFYMNTKMAIEIPFDIKLKKFLNKSYDELVEEICQ
ncbi:ATP-binding cassette domain-containing protein [Oceanotoga sp. DSM 15011]|uniref:Energy-coupling factor transport system ATP-binding protein n=1 Tax=Oceanotoga teriensis TaxID=515440 RepID=A0AA45C8C6_9BACT|nr:MULTISPECIES: ATP-binding cassette domain-containing protein [Oceanotoga]MDN5341221.1 energy-coupling factor transport system ATP-binding protein [Oceanotoga sp.]MDO7976900.1 ATP-binding cassette domain-containing protein [Oceanotoga teriensis]PWJ95981.1 energy-coupling factor transport system ATP-binding protein [Oceanotoga teriensis]UYP00797.1 ATP-binding cassette domain-containing protein [Oceanotoga sp. DSM 15011]